MVSKPVADLKGDLFLAICGGRGARRHGEALVHEGGFAGAGDAG